MGHLGESVRGASSGLMLEGNVITGEMVTTWPRETEVIIAKTAIITPLANDVIRDRRLTVVRQVIPKEGVDRRNANVISGVVSPVMSRLADEIPIESHEDDPRVLADHVNGRISPDCQKVIVFSTQPGFVACLINRNQACRAVVMSDVSELKKLSEGFDPNVFCVDPSGLTLFQTRRLIKGVWR